MSILAQFAIGLVFGLGLVIAGMSDPAKVLNFLDLGAIPTGGWDPSLAFVMGGAIAVTFAGFRLVLRRKQPIFGGRSTCRPQPISTPESSPARRSSAWAGGLPGSARARPSRP